MSVARTSPHNAFSDDQKTPVIEARNLEKSYLVGGGFTRKRFCALQNISFLLYPGQCIALVGESGSGKSTVLKIISRLEPPTAGAIIFRGKNILEQEPHRASLSYRRQVQMIFQDPFASLNPFHTVQHHLARPLLRHQIIRDQTALNPSILDLLERVGLTPPGDFIQARPHELSGGQRQRVAIARALAVEPSVIVADEPISMLDVSIRMGILNLLRDLKTQVNMAQLYVTHDLASARTIADRIIVLYAGTIVEEGPTDAIVTSPAHPYTQMLLSAAPGANKKLPKSLPVVGGSTKARERGAGCLFAQRCPHAFERCHNEVPQRQAIEGDDPQQHHVRCHLFHSMTRACKSES